MFNTVDFSGDNKISLDEYMAAMGQVSSEEHKLVSYTCASYQHYKLS